MLTAINKKTKIKFLRNPSFWAMLAMAINLITGAIYVLATDHPRQIFISIIAIVVMLVLHSTIKYFWDKALKKKIEIIEAYKNALIRLHGYESINDKHKIDLAMRILENKEATREDLILIVRSLPPNSPASDKALDRLLKA
ncbi:MAG: hypothetical protein US50_C0071G0006 [Candidatus Nomurabacteria bacterium GW2011_GWB1_37_5]|uniref:Uncharacterized protein n=1 Tax=Candidatus Nomurabacteria bacterium GW2011_GWB1_37_5 TaxID=1618742 RepID=A0A0G0GUQ8_9BACT|nr:MAG: hypothetical protein US50_C0071G0006 [Candidatus Nomurabacteria bacterium GW2011_GWB1_37_5]